MHSRQLTMNEVYTVAWLWQGNGTTALLDLDGNQVVNECSLNDESDEIEWTHTQSTMVDEGAAVTSRRTPHERGA